MVDFAKIKFNDYAAPNLKEMRKAIIALIANDNRAGHCCCFWHTVQFYRCCRFYSADHE